MTLAIRDINLPPWLADVTRMQWISLAVGTVSFPTLCKSYVLKLSNLNLDDSLCHCPLDLLAVLPSTFQIPRP
jgi:hypothetical protein